MVHTINICVFSVRDQRTGKSDSISLNLNLTEFWKKKWRSECKQLNQATEKRKRGVVVQCMKLCKVSAKSIDYLTTIVTKEVEDLEKGV